MDCSLFDILVPTPFSLQPNTHRKRIYSCSWYFKNRRNQIVWFPIEEITWTYDLCANIGFLPQWKNPMPLFPLVPIHTQKSTISHFHWRGSQLEAAKAVILDIARNYIHMCHNCSYSDYKKLWCCGHNGETNSFISIYSFQLSPEINSIT